MAMKKRVTEFYASVLKDLCEVRPYVFLAVAIYLAGLLVGLVFTGRFEILLDSFKRLAARFAGHSIPVLILMIFLQNFFASFVSVWVGALLGLVPAAAAATNGIMLSVVFSTAARGDVWGAIVKLIPHGMFEMPAVFISWGLGLWRGAWLFRKRREVTFRQRAVRAYGVFFSIVVPLLAIAAILEGLGIWYWKTH